MTGLVTARPGDEPAVAFPVAFWVDGVPGTAGSKTPIPYRDRGGRIRVALRDGRTRKAAHAHAAWRETVAATARACYRGPLLVGPVQLAVVFVRPRPQSHLRADGTVRPSAPAWPAVRPDTSKYLRALEDALSGVLWADDAQIVLHQLAKVWGARAGAAVAVAPVNARDRSMRALLWDSALAVADQGA